MKTLLVIGGTSGIAKAAIKEFSKTHKIYITYHSEQSLNESKQFFDEIAIKASFVLNLEDTPEQVYQNTLDLFCLTQPNDVLIAPGLLDCNHKELNKKLTTLQTVNFTAVTQVLLACREYYLLNTVKGFWGSIMCISSVAGDRGRASNYFYGSAKAGLTAFLSGLRAELYQEAKRHKDKIYVMTIDCGPVSTRMTGYKTGRLFASPEAVGKAIYRGYLKKKDVIYTPWFWRGIMCAVKAIPEVIFKRLKI